MAVVRQHLPPSSPLSQEQRSMACISGECSTRLQAPIRTSLCYCSIAVLAVTKYVIMLGRQFAEQQLKGVVAWGHIPATLT